jgi:HAD superfamily hydrolase (TIGR01450 family)
MTDFVIDLDGTVYCGGVLIPGATARIRWLRSAGHRVLFATNDATLTCSQRAARLTEMGLPAAPSDVINSASAVARYLAQCGCTNSRVMIVGPDAVATELRQVLPELKLVPATGSREADVVVVGLDPAISLDRLGAAHAAITAGARFLATNADAVYPTREGGTAPGAGAIVAALERSTGRPAVTAGKPGPLLFHLAAERLGVSPDSLTVVGDAPSDIQAAMACGAASVLVRTGVPAETDGPDYQPDLVLPSIAELPERVMRRRVADGIARS